MVRLHAENAHRILFRQSSLAYNRKLSGIHKSFNSEEKFMQRTLLVTCTVLLLSAAASFGVDSAPWYTQGKFKPALRVEIELVNTLDLERTDEPVVIPRSSLPMQDLQEMWITLVDPNGIPRDEPTPERLRQFGYHEIRAEQNGRMLFHQADDIDKDGVWDELFFITDLKPNERKTIYLYIGFNDRGWNEHTTHATIGSYCRHLIPFWESENVGWKLWYYTDCDVFGKRVPQLMSQNLSMQNLDGYGVPRDMGSDIMGVGKSLGGGGIVLFEDPESPETVSRPRFTPARTEAGFEEAWNIGPVSDTRYAFDVVVNGPLRSMIRVKTFNWNTGNGTYALEQLYTAYTRQNYTTCKVKFSEFLPLHGGVLFGCGIKKHPNESTYYQQDGTIVTAGSEEIVNPDDVDGIQKITVDYVGSACIVKDSYNPAYQFVPEYDGNHTFKIEPAADHSFEYLLAAAWSEGPPFGTANDFKRYVLDTGWKYNNPVRPVVHEVERVDAE
jgi:hypothetical protein